jgi:hypothetical protein
MRSELTRLAPLALTMAGPSARMHADSLARIEGVQMPGPTTQSLSNNLQALSTDVSTLRSGFSEFRAQVNIQLAFIKWVGVFLSGILVALVAGAVNIAWNASALNSEVKQQGARIEKIEKNSEAIIQHLEQIERRLETVAARLVPDDQQPKTKPNSGE